MIPHPGKGKDENFIELCSGTISENSHGEADENSGKLQLRPQIRVADLIFTILNIHNSRD